MSDITKTSTSAKTNTVAKARKGAASGPSRVL